MPQTEDWTVGRLLAWTTDYLTRHGADTARLDAEILLAHARRCQRIQLYTDFDQAVDPAVRTTFRELIRRRADGTPVAYLVGHRQFYSLTFRVTPDVLIPRPETELVVVSLLDLIKQHGPMRPPAQIADVGTGSGVLAVCAAKHVPGCHVTATDLSRAALEVAQANAAAHGVADQIEFVQGDLLSAVKPEQTFHYVVSNPPYVSEADWQGLAREVRQCEPRLALVAGPTGAEVIARLIPQAADRLVPGGWLLVEISPLIDRRARQLVEDQLRLEPPCIVTDLAGLPRVLIARRR